jgi:hypothetical protein
MKKTICFFSSAFFCLFVNAQEKDDEAKKLLQSGLADKFPAARVFDVQFVQYLPSDFDTKLLGKDFQDGEIKSHSKVRFAANLPIVYKPKWNITTSLLYRYEAFELQNVTEKSQPSLPAYNDKIDYHYLSGALSFTYFSNLGKMPFIYNASVIVDGTQKDAERIKGFLGASLVIKRTAQTVMTVGGLILIDPASPVPFTPTFTLDYKFKNSPWRLDFILPQRLLVKRNVFTNGRLSLGTELVTDGFYIYNSTPGYASVYDYRQLELRSGITYEHNISDVILTFKTGISTFFNNRLSERGKSTNDYILSLNRDATGYFTLGASYNPFRKKK